jgi:hypothetical protein
MVSVTFTGEGIGSPSWLLVLLQSPRCFLSSSLKKLLGLMFSPSLERLHLHQILLMWDLPALNSDYFHVESMPNNVILIRDKENK